MEETFKKFFGEKFNLSAENKVLIAFSGGVDSVVLTYLMKRAGFAFGIAHCNFSLRGIDSEKDAEFARDLALGMEVPFFLKKFNTENQAANQNISIQMAARNLRYEWLEDIRNNNHFKVIATAHHKNDILETILFNLSKGTGIAGIHGIKPIQGNIIRPLLFADKEMIRAYAKKNNLFWREDTSNQSVKYHRNLIRHKVVPELKKINPSLEDTLETTVERISAVEDVFLHTVDEIKKSSLKIKNGNVKIELPEIRKYPTGHIILYEILREYGFNYDQVKSLYLSGRPGKKIISEEYFAILDREKVILQKHERSEYSRIIKSIGEGIEVEGFHLKTRGFSVNELQLSSASSKAFLDKQHIKFPLKVRNWEKGDRFIPLGMKNKKKLSDFFIDNKIPLSEKNQYPVVLSQNEIIWVAGLRIDDRFKITEKTEEVLEISIEKL